MKSVWLSYTMTLFFLTIAFALFFWLITPSFTTVKLTFHSPLPEFLNMAKNDQVKSLDWWIPNENNPPNNGLTQLDITGKSALSYDISTDQFLYEKNNKGKMPMASLTKIMTDILALEHKKKDDQYSVRKQSIVGQDSVGLAEAEVLSLDDLLYGLILHSGNDAAEVIADNAIGGRQKFIQDMNNRTKTLGIFDTHFTNPTGLEGDGNQYTTSYDLLLMTKYALAQFPEFANIAATPHYVLAATTTHQEYDLENETNLLTTYPGVRGVKTGYTPEAGLCLITYLEYKDHKIIAVLLGSEDRRNEMIKILDYSLKQQG